MSKGGGGGGGGGERGEYVNHVARQSGSRQLQDKLNRNGRRVVGAREARNRRLPEAETRDVHSSTREHKGTKSQRRRTKTSIKGTAVGINPGIQSWPST